MSRILTAALCVLMWLPRLTAQTPAQAKLDFDLAQIGMVLNGKHICEDKGRLQDYSSKVMEQIIAAGPKAIPVLIEKITNPRPAGKETDEPIICYWYGMAVGDIAFCTLLDLFSSTDGKATIPGASWNAMLGAGDERIPAWEQYNDFIKKHGRKAIQVKWQKLWSKYGSQMYWDAKGRCFGLKAN